MSIFRAVSFFRSYFTDKGVKIQQQSVQPTQQVDTTKTQTIKQAVFKKATEDCENKEKSILVSTDQNLSD